jgi:hypothetical protein
MLAAAKGGHLHVLRWIREVKCDDDDAWFWTEVCAGAARGGHLRVLQFAREECEDDAACWDFWTPFKAAQRGHVEVFKWVCERSRGRINLLPSARVAAQFGRTEILRYIVTKAPGRLFWARLASQNYRPHVPPNTSVDVNLMGRWRKHVVALAVANGRLECAKFLLDRFAFEPKAELCKIAAVGNALPVLRWLVEERNFPFDVRFCVGLLIRDGIKLHPTGAVLDVEDFQAKHPEEWAVAQTLRDVANARRGPDEDALPSLGSMYEDRVKKVLSTRGAADGIRAYTAKSFKMVMLGAGPSVKELLMTSWSTHPDVEDRAWEDDDEGDILDDPDDSSYTLDDDGFEETTKAMMDDWAPVVTTTGGPP